MDETYHKADPGELLAKGCRQLEVIEYFLFIQQREEQKLPESKRTGNGMILPMQLDRLIPKQGTEFQQIFGLDGELWHSDKLQDPENT